MFPNSQFTIETRSSLIHRLTHSKKREFVATVAYMQATKSRYLHVASVRFGLVGAIISISLIYEHEQMKY